MLSLQKTIQSEASISGVGLFTGEKVSLRLCPAAPDTGIRFRRMDLSGKPWVPALLPYVGEAVRCTRLVAGRSSVMMVEHLLSALFAYGVDNVVVEIEGPEIPAVDGSAQPFLELIEKSGLVSQEAPRRCGIISRPVSWSEGEVHLVALPSSEFRISYTLHYPHSPLLRSQYYSFVVQPLRYKAEIALSRTFSLYEEILPFVEKGWIKGGGLENALVIQGGRILNPEGARFENEMVRHKILDLIGDLALIGMPIQAHVIAIRSGHASNVAFAKVLAKALEQEERVFIPKAVECGR
ncbi:MAG: UDP-3-O-[3-hydroxymyristoyl] N-acetylglucosamine deacetylase [Verrucomicrobiota bacterium]|nr:UDP-3-O-[3-hydroxymyristoyl] N-acetylglucosamine deacetylase [Verrucomicrobiota bacterium]